jgi:hypothetical protein
MFLLFAVAAAAMMAAFLVESSSWWIKGVCAPGMIGLYVSRSNIYLYFGRFFALAYNALIAFSIENGASAECVAATLAIGFAMTSLAHIVLLMGGAPTHFTIGILSRILFLPDQRLTVEERRPPLNWSIALSTAVASLCFSLGISLPLLLAVFVPQYRMSLSYVGQTVNAVGTILLLFMVDQQLFRSLDEGKLQRDLPSYSMGRLWAFGGAALVCWVLYEIIDHA